MNHPISGLRALILISFCLATGLVLNAHAKAAGNDFSLRFNQEQYAADPSLSEQSSQYSDLYLREKYQSKGTLFSSGVDAFAVLPMDDKGDYLFAIPELYTNAKVHDHLALTVGRRLENWSELDQHYRLGLWQPLVRWDAANPVEQGFTGVFIGMGPQSSRLTLFYSRIFLPDQNPNYQVKDGKIVSNSRWFRAPVSQAELNYGSSNIFYQVNEPEVSDVILNDTYAAMYSVGDPQTGSFLRLSYADKPANQFHLGIDAEGIYLLDNGDLEPKIYPVIVRHRLYTVETGFHASRRNIIFSSTWERYENPDLPEGWEETELIDGNYFGGFWNEALSVRGMARSTIELGYIQKHDETDPRVSTVIKGEVSASTQRFAFEKLGVIGLKHDFFKTAKRELSSGIRYVYSVSDSGEWISGFTNYSPEPNWTISLQFDIFGVPEKEAVDQSFISTFRSNDRVIGGLTYVF